MIRLDVWLIVLSQLILGMGVASSQSYPIKNIRIVTSDAGSSVDFASRLLAQGISGPLGQQVIVDNRPSGVIPGEVVSKAFPDGYTLLVSASALWLAPFFQSNVPYDPVKDFSPVSMLVRSPNIVVVHPSLPVKSVKDLIALAKAKPGDLNYASTGTGGTQHLATELFKAMAGVNLVRVTYRGGVQALNDLVAGQVHVAFAIPTSVSQHIKAGRMRAIAVTSIEPFALFPELPTVDASLPGYEAVVMIGMFAPAKTPEIIVRRLNQEIVRLLRTADAQQRFLNSGVVTVGDAPEQFSDAIKAEMTRLGKVIKDANIHGD